MRRSITVTDNARDFGLHASITNTTVNRGDLVAPSPRDRGCGKLRAGSGRRQTQEPDEAEGRDRELGGPSHRCSASRLRPNRKPRVAGGYPFG